MLRQKRTGKLVFVGFRALRLHRQVSSTIVSGWMSVSEAAARTLCQPVGFSPIRGNSLDAERIAAIWTNGWLSLFRLRSIGNDRLQTGLGTPFESAAAALLDVMRRIIAGGLITAGTVVKVKQDVVLAINATAFVTFDLEKVEFFAILMRAAVADIFENAFVLGHRTEIKFEGSGDLIRT